MSAFQAYAGAYESRGVFYKWRCYATARVHEVRTFDQGGIPEAPHGKRWILKSRREGEPEVAWLMDESTVDFSQILLQVEAHPAAAAQPRREMREEPRLAEAV
jgi:hypothetical protein